MTAWRGTLLVLLAAFAGVPLLLPFREAIAYGSLADFEAAGIPFRHIVWNTAALILGTLAVALPLGSVAAILLFRTDLPGRRLWQMSTILFLFIPLTVLLAGWQNFLGPDGVLPLPAWRVGPSMWAQGLVPAIWIHGLAGVPWVILIVGAGLSGVERELEEEALLSLPAWKVLCCVTLPRCRVSFAVAACWLALFVFGESSVAYFVQVPTFAEEVHNRFGTGRPEALASNVLITLPMIVVLSALLVVLIQRAQKNLPPLQGSSAPPRLFALGPWKVSMAVVVALAAVPLLLMPFVGLVAHVGRAGSGYAWTPDLAVSRLVLEAQVVWGALLKTVFLAALTALGSTLLGVVCCWQARDSAWLRHLLVLLAALAWAMPAPVLGLGLKETINLLLELRLQPLSDVLYYRPSPVPVFWVQVLRFLPVSLALTWPLVRNVPRELLEDARLHGATPCRELLHVIVPAILPGLAWTVIVLVALCLGEVSASSRVETAGWETFPKILLDRMHYGADTAVATLCLLQLGCLAVLGVAGYLLAPLVTGRNEPGRG